MIGVPDSLGHAEVNWFNFKLEFVLFIWNVWNFRSANLVGTKVLSLRILVGRVLPFASKILPLDLIPEF